MEKKKKKKKNSEERKEKGETVNQGNGSFPYQY